MPPTRRSFAPGDRVVIVSAADGHVGTVVGVAREEHRPNPHQGVEAVRVYLVQWPTRAGRHVTNQIAATALRAATEAEIPRDKVAKSRASDSEAIEARTPTWRPSPNA
jgi:hypothetical protein